MSPPLIRPSPLTSDGSWAVKKNGAPVGGAHSFGPVLELAYSASLEDAASWLAGSNPARAITKLILAL